jgi:serine/threonine-protein kinase
MVIDSVESFLTVLRRVELLAPEQADEVARELGPHYADPQRLGEYLVEIDWLTAYQLRLLLTGRWDDLTVGPYHVLDRLGEGGESEVFKAWDTQRGRLVALKVLRRTPSVRPESLPQFRGELQALTRLSHAHVIKTYTAHQAGDLHYFAMELAEGVDLDCYVRDNGPLPLAHACEYARQAAQGLQHAHQLGLVHRDIKPANLFLVHPPEPGSPERRGPEPVVKIIDWGLARLKRPAPGRDASNRAADPPAAEPDKGGLVGTADYIAPEQAFDPGLVDSRADVYSLGCTLYFLLTGQPPFPGGSLMQKLIQHQEADRPAARAAGADVPPELDEILRKMMARRPEDRYQIPLLVVNPLRRFCPGGQRLLGPDGTLRSGGNCPTLLASSTANLLRPSTAVNLGRPSTVVDLPRQAPGTGCSGRPSGS